MSSKIDILPKGFMAYVKELSDKAESIQENTTKEKLYSLIITLQSLKVTKGLVVEKIKPIQEEITSTISEDGFQDYVDGSFKGISIKIKDYISYISDNLTHSELEANILSNFIMGLLDKIDKIYSDLEAYEVKEDISEGKKEVEKSEDLNLPTEEEEEIDDFQKNAFTCLKCESPTNESTIGGCKKCGGNIFQATYLN